jgi:hypothetical protein
LASMQCEAETYVHPTGAYSLAEDKTPGMADLPAVSLQLNVSASNWQVSGPICCQRRSDATCICTQ